jgi:hypothetical protein
VTKAILVARFLRARASWRLESPGASARHVARSVVSLLDAAGYADGLPDDDPSITALDAAGCFTGGIFDPGPEGWTIVRMWQLADEASAGPEDLLTQLARAASHHGPAPSYHGPAPSYHSLAPSHDGLAASHANPAAQHASPAASHASPPAQHASPAASHASPAAQHASLARPAAQAIIVPRQAGPGDDRITGRGATGSRNAT